MRRMLWRMLPDRVLTLSMVSGLGGDRKLSDDEQQKVAMLLAQRGNGIYSDLMFTLTHQWFPPDDAKEIWHLILKHKYEISSILGRNVRITVAAVDYLFNMRGGSEIPAIVAEQSMWEMAEIAVRDSLTKLYDLPTFCMQLEAEIKRHKRYGTPLSVIILDVDDFKRCNDRWGHLYGDKVLRRIAKMITASGRDVDTCARWGGEEFSVLVAQTGSEGAVVIADRIRESVERSLRTKNVTISAGISSCPEDGASVQGLIRKADQAMYYSKQNGKNRVTAYSQIAEKAEPVHCPEDEGQVPHAVPLDSDSSYGFT